jgi:hypothetical protein
VWLCLVVLGANGLWMFLLVCMCVCRKGLCVEVLIPCRSCGAMGGMIFHPPLTGWLGGLPHECGHRGVFGYDLRVYPC